jgi:hypothetical protein
MGIGDSIVNERGMNGRRKERKKGRKKGSKRNKERKEGRLAWAARTRVRLRAVIKQRAGTNQDEHGSPDLTSYCFNRAIRAAAPY